MIQLATTQTFMNWQDKVDKWMQAKNLNATRVATEIGLSGPGFRKVLENPSGWSTVKTAIRLARLMETTVEFLFDDDATWPPPPPAKLGIDQARLAIQALERIATGSQEGGAPPAKSSPSTQETGKKQRHRK